MHGAYEDRSLFPVQKNQSSFLRLPFEESGPTAAATDTKDIYSERCSYKHQEYDRQTKERIDGNVDCQLVFLKKESASTSVTPSISILNVIIAEIKNKSMSILISILSDHVKRKTVKRKALLDIGAGGKFINQNFVLRENIRTHKLAKPITIYNVDGTENKTGTITQYVDVNLQIGNRTTSTKLLVTGLGCQKIILGFPWFKEQNLKINWETGTLTWQKENRTPATSIEVLDEEEYLNRTQNTLDEDKESIISFMDVNSKFKPVWVNVKTNLAMDMAIENNLKKQECMVEEMVPKEYHEFLNVFMKEGFEPKSFKNYNLTPEEQVELDKFLKEILEKGYI